MKGGRELGYIFQFKNGVMEVGMIVFSSSYASEIITHLLNRYVLGYKSGDIMLFVNGLTTDSWTVGAFYEVSDSEITVMYASRAYLDSETTQQQMMAKMCAMFDKQG